ncbi:MAG TPA: Mur ligase family protein [Planctomycetota bacterium]|nr:Mur ligase family protein [Planctomycetota bacterium]
MSTSHTLPRPALPGRTPRLPERVHFLGAGGAGVSGATLLLHAAGHRVSASDRADSEHTRMLRQAGIDVKVGEEESRLPEDVGLVVRSAAVPESDARVREALERGVPVLKYSELLGRITPAGRTLAVAGTHGKTTTSWMLHHALRGLLEARLGDVAARARHPDAPLPGELPAPGALIGGLCRELGVNAVQPAPGGWFAVEACEYDRSFLQLAPAGAVITNVEADHLDYFGDLDTIKGAFARFADRVHPNGLLVVGQELPRRVEEGARCPVWRLERDLKVQLTSERAGCFSFRLRGPEFSLEEVHLAVPGRFNVDNAALALALVVGLAAREWCLDPDEAARAAARGLERFRGSQRRFEPWGEVDGVSVVHDYAHHPTEVRATIEAARRALAGRPLHVLFQPHQHSRTARFLGEFVESLRGADRVVVADVYGARAHIDGGHLAGAPELVANLARAGVAAEAGGDLAASVRIFARGLPERCAALVLGAGDVDGIREELTRAVAVRGAP